MAALEARKELGQTYEREVVDAFLERVEHAIAARVEAKREVAALWRRSKKSAPQLDQTGQRWPSPSRPSRSGQRQLPPLLAQPAGWSGGTHWSRWSSSGPLSRRSTSPTFAGAADELLLNACHVTAGLLTQKPNDRSNRSPRRLNSLMCEEPPSSGPRWCTS